MIKNSSVGVRFEILLWLYGPEKFPGLSRNGPFVDCKTAVFFANASDGIIFERKVWSEWKNGEGEWWETRACEARVLHTRGSRSRRFAPSEHIRNEHIRKRLFCSLGPQGTKHILRTVKWPVINFYELIFITPGRESVMMLLWKLIWKQI